MAYVAITLVARRKAAAASDKHRSISVAINIMATRKTQTWRRSYQQRKRTAAKIGNASIIISAAAWQQRSSSGISIAA